MSLADIHFCYHSMQPVTSKSVDNLTHLLVKELADMEKKVAFASPAIAFPIMVLPVPWCSKTKMAFSKSVVSNFQQERGPCQWGL
jgi:hypothetical protein